MRKSKSGLPVPNNLKVLEREFGLTPEYIKWLREWQEAKKRKLT